MNQDSTSTGPNPGATGATPPTQDDVVCVSIRRGEHFYRFACDPQGVRELLERLAALADENREGETSLTWDDAELVATQILSHQTSERGQAAPRHDR